jgi:hypothetical protein
VLRLGDPSELAEDLGEDAEEGDAGDR